MPHEAKQTLFCIQIYSDTKQYHNVSQFLYATLPFNQILRIYLETSQGGKSEFTANISSHSGTAVCQLSVNYSAGQLMVLFTDVPVRTCSGIQLLAKSEWQTLTSRGYPYTYITYLSCWWQINTTTPGFTVNLQILDLDVGESDIFGVGTN